MSRWAASAANDALAISLRDVEQLSQRFQPERWVAQAAHLQPAGQRMSLLLSPFPPQTPNHTDTTETQNRRTTCETPTLQFKPNAHGQARCTPQPDELPPRDCAESVEPRAWPRGGPPRVEPARLRRPRVRASARTQQAPSPVSSVCGWWERMRRNKEINEWKVESANPCSEGAEQGAGPCARSSGRARRRGLRVGSRCRKRFNCFVHSFVQSVRLLDVP